jgi:pyruvate-formate lyase-activating enzyme
LVQKILNNVMVTEKKTHLSIDVKRILRTIYKNVCESGDKTPLKTTSFLTEVPLSTIQRIVKLPEENLSRKERVKGTIVESFSENEKTEIKK